MGNKRNKKSQSQQAAGYFLSLKLGNYRTKVRGITPNLSNKKIISIFARYLLLLAFGFFAMSLFYIVFTPLTVYPSYFLFKIFYNTSFLVKETIYFKNIALYIAPSCVAGAAYFLLTILNFTTPIPLFKRILSILFSYIAFLLINILRIFLFAVFFVSAFSLYNLTHLVFWYAISTLIVFFVWLLTIRIFSIEKIPFYSDFRFLYALTRKKR